MKRFLFGTAVIAAAVAVMALGTDRSSADARLANAQREPARAGWIPVHLSGSPTEIGYQHGYLLAPEIKDNYDAIRLSMTHESRDWNFFRTASESVLWPHIEQEYRDELQGIVNGVQAKGVKLDIWDVVTMNAYMELSPYYLNWYEKQHSTGAAPKPVPDHCSAFVATGSYTRDGKVVIGHNDWTDYLTAARWNVIFDITPAKGHRFIMDGMPGLIHSGDDFGINNAGIVITETTISQFHGFDPNGIPEFVRARKAMQYSSTIDDFAGIMREGNNGGYANNWLVADTRANEIASLELGLKNTPLSRTKDGYFVGANYPVDPALTADETDFDVHNMSVSSNARRVRWEELMKEYKGRINTAAGERFLGDHFDTFDKKEVASERTICGHVDKSSRGMKPWQPAFGTAGVAQSKVTDAAMAARMSMYASFGHSCGLRFDAAKHIQAHPEFAWEKPLLRDIPSNPWALFTVGGPRM
jgi:hypothetical protein